MNDESWTIHEKRIRRVTDYIYEHLDEELDLNKLADIACMSAYHWHRVYTGILGETPAMTVKRLRLQRAAAELIATELPIGRIAERCGYPNLQSFNRIFKSEYGKPPAAFRKAGLHIPLTRKIREASIAMYEISIRQMPDIVLAGTPHTGPYMNIGEAFNKVQTIFMQTGNIAHSRGMVGLYYDDPASAPQEELRSAACIRLADGADVPEGLEAYHIAGGEFAVLLHKGPYPSLSEAYQWLYHDWIGQSGRELRDVPPMEIYLNTPYDTPEAELMTEICLALES